MCARRLEALGHTLGERSMIGAAQLALFDAASCYFWGGADGRRDSGAAGVNHRRTGSRSAMSNVALRSVTPGPGRCPGRAAAFDSGSICSNWFEDDNRG